jgi:primary-amine oxidase
MASFAKSWVAFSASILFLWVVFLASAPLFRHVESYLQFLACTREYCEISVFRAPKQNVWADLSQSEADELMKFLFASPELNLTDISKATRFVFVLTSRWACFDATT